MMNLKYLMDQSNDVCGLDLIILDIADIAEDFKHPVILIWGIDEDFGLHCQQLL